MQEDVFITNSLFSCRGAFKDPTDLMNRTAPASCWPSVLTPGSMLHVHVDVKDAWTFGGSDAV